MIKSTIEKSINLKIEVSQNDAILHTTELISNLVVKTISNGNKLLLAGNGGSASDALHIAGEFVGRFLKERKAYPAYVLNADVASMTAIANDYGYDEVFARQLEAHGLEGDLFWSFTTSGNSKNVIKAMKKAKEIGLINVVFTGNDGGEAAQLADYVIIVPSNETARIQEIHILLGHIICELSEIGLENVV